MASLIVALFCLANVAAGTRPEPKEVSAERADAILKSFAERTKTLLSFQARCERTAVHPLTKKKTIYKGEIAWKLPNMLMVDLTQSDEVGKKDADKTAFERFYLDGKHLYEYVPREKLILTHAIPNNFPFSDRPFVDHPAISLLKGLPPAELKKRFEIRVTESAEGWYAYLTLVPKIPDDRKESSLIRIAVYLKNSDENDMVDLTYIPCQIFWIQPTGHSVTYEFSAIVPNAKLDDKAFAPRAIDGYRQQRVSERK